MRCHKMTKIESAQSRGSQYCTYIDQNCIGRPPHLVLTVWERSLLKSATLVPEAMHKSAFFRLCFFFEGFEITFIRLE